MQSKRTIYPGQIERTCERCGASFVTWPCYLKRGGGRFCSSACSSASFIRPKDQTCKYCGQSFHINPFQIKRGRVFCSDACRKAGTKQPIAERFWPKVDKRGGDDACWPWLGGRFESGYGQFSQRPRNLRAHRVAYELTHGQIPDNLMVLHECDNPPCCNPKHLFLGTNDDNMADRQRKGRTSKQGRPRRAN